MLFDVIMIIKFSPEWKSINIDLLKLTNVLEFHVVFNLIVFEVKYVLVMVIMMEI